MQKSNLLQWSHHIFRYIGVFVVHQKNIIYPFDLHMMKHCGARAGLSAYAWACFSVRARMRLCVLYKFKYILFILLCILLFLSQNCIFFLMSYLVSFGLIFFTHFLCWQLKISIFFTVCSIYYVFLSE